MTASTLQLIGAGCFGAVLGWFLYYVNRYRSDAVQITDVATLVGVLGGGAILTLFPEQTDLFGAYGIGLAAGFFAYFVALLVFVRRADGWTVAWFLDGRRPPLGGGERAGTAESGRAMPVKDDRIKT